MSHGSSVQCMHCQASHWHMLVLPAAKCEQAFYSVSTLHVNWTRKHAGHLWLLQDELLAKPRLTTAHNNYLTVKSLLTNSGVGGTAVLTARLKPRPHQQHCRSNIVECYKVERCFNTVAVFTNNVEATGNKVVRWFDNAALTLLLVWTKLYSMEGLYPTSFIHTANYFTLVSFLQLQVLRQPKFAI